MANNFRRKPLYVPRQLLAHPAWLTLTGIAPQVYLLIRMRMQICRTRRSPRGDGYETVNNGRIRFPYREAKQKFGWTSKRFARAIDQLVEHGLLDISHSGGQLHGDCSEYAVSDRWRKFEKPEFQKVTRRKGRPWVTRQSRERAEERDELR